MALEIEDDVFYAEISKQIAKLVTDDEEDDVFFPVQSPPLDFQGFHHMPQSMMAPTYAHEMAYLYRRSESKGTGVFIPRSSLPFTKKKEKNAANNNNKKKKKKQNNSNSTSKNVPMTSERLDRLCIAIETS